MSTATLPNCENSPPNSLQNSIARRLAYRSRIKTELAAQVENEVCRRDLLHWADHWPWTLDPRKAQALIPFDLFPKQDEFLRWLQDREAAGQNGLVEKSRDMGVTWLCVAFSVHRWLYRPGYSIGFGSRKEQYVDDLGNPDSIFEKVRILLDNLPTWMMPAGWTRREHGGFCKIINPANSATITGEAGDNIGRGGRKSIYFVDESAFIERAQFIERSLVGNTNCRIDVSTPNGPGNPFAKKRFGGKVPVFTMHWKDDLRKGDDWYAEQVANYDPVTVAQEIDIDYTASIEGICCSAAWVRAAVDYPLESTGPIIAGLDVAAEGSNLSAFVPRRGPSCLFCKTWQGILPIQLANAAIDEAEKIGCEELRYDCIGVGEGVKSAFKVTERILPFKPIAWNAGDAATECVYSDGRKGHEKFANLRAEAWWSVRERFRKTYERVTLGTDYSDDECISLPNDPELIAELSMPLVLTTETGKIRIESKKDMAKRGIKSPDRADGLIMGYAPMTPVREFWFA